MPQTPQQEIASLRAEILRLRIPIEQGERYFIPQNALESLMTKEKVRTAVTACAEIQSFQRDELVDIILRGAVQIFAILVLLKGEEGLILRFVETDGFQRTALDARLPLSRPQVLDLTSEENADDFYEKQWEFVVPFFSKAVIHRSILPSTRLPFLRDVDTKREGGFGHIFEIQIHPEYHDFPSYTDDEGQCRLVRKEFLSSAPNSTAFEQETENLNILNQIKHPNIIEMLGSYTYRGKHNLIFPMAAAGDLSFLMSQVVRPIQFCEDIDIYKALSEVFSAIAAVHHPLAGEVDLALIGIHHDLKPQNILVQGNTFLLADFGLARFKSSDQTSKSLFKIGQGHYLAPECEDYEDGFRKYAVSRSSDIWSFGCILADIATYIAHGAGGVQSFKQARKVRVGGFTTYTFHAGCGAANSGVTKWLDELQASTDRPELIDLIKDMLHMNPSCRPRADNVTARLCLVAILAYSEHVKLQFKSLSDSRVSYELEILNQMFEAWSTTMFAAVKRIEHFTNGMDYAKVVSRLQGLRKELHSTLIVLQKAVQPRFSNIRYEIEKLHDILPLELKQQVLSRFELWMLQGRETDHNIHSKLLNNDLGAVSRRLSMLMTMKRLDSIMTPQDNDTESFKLSASSIRITDRFENYMLGTRQNPNSNLTCQVLIEQVHYDQEWEGSVGEELFARMAAVAELLQHLSGPGYLPILPCLGFYHMPSRFSFEFVFECPPATLTTTLPPCVSKPLTLQAIIHRTARSRTRPSLNSRIRLAQTLTTTLLDFHKTRWLHKGMSAYNVLLFPSAGSSADTWLDAATYLIGFNRSRQDSIRAFTYGPDSSGTNLMYMHPRYVEQQCRFRRSFDYFSLGLVLLEIGLWQHLEQIILKLQGPTEEDPGAVTTLASVAQERTAANVEDGAVLAEQSSRSGSVHMSTKILRELLTKRVPILAHTMGVSYCSAVSKCLRWDDVYNDDVATTDPDESNDDHRNANLLEFQHLVERPIATYDLNTLDVLHLSQVSQVSK